MLDEPHCVGNDSFVKLTAVVEDHISVVASCKGLGGAVDPFPVLDV
jgi:hypothetical protein